MAKRTRHVEVIEKRQITPNMLRIILGGDDLKDFPSGQESAYIKLQVEDEDTHQWVNRSYTIRAFDPRSYQLTLDFVVHHDGGPASQWSLQTRVGDTIDINGPGPTKLVQPNADWYFLVGDMTALPALSVNLEKLSKDAKGYAVIEVISTADKQRLEKPEGIELIWVINVHADKPNTMLADKVRSLPWLAGMPEVWLATEFAAMRNMRRYFRKEQSVPKGNVYASSYWKMGDTDEGNKLAKKNDTEAD